MVQNGFSPSKQASSMLHGWENIEGDISRNALGSSHGKHRPYTRGGGYNAESHSKVIAEGREGRPQKQIVPINGGGFYEKVLPPPPRTRVPTATRDILLPLLPGERPEVRGTLRGQVATDWPYHRGATPPPLDPQPQYEPCDTRDENGKMYEDGLHPGARMYHAVNGGRGENGGGAGFLNGLPLSNYEGKYTTVRVAGRGVMDGDEAARIAAAKRAGLKNMLSPNESGNINPRVNLQAGGLWGRPMELVPVELYMNPELRITELDLSENLFRFLPEGLCNLASVTRLEVSACRLERLPGMIHRLRNLKVLSASRNLLNRLPVSIPQLTSLQTLDVSNNRFHTVPPYLTQLTNLKVLSLSCNMLKTEFQTVSGDESAFDQIPSFGGMSSLEKLSLDCNLLTVVPEGMHELPSLRFLNLSSNKIASRGTGFTKFPPRDARERLIALSLMPKVETLLLSGNVLEEIPPDMCALSTLTELGIGNNRISELPREIIHLTRLTSLNVDRCPIIAMPTELAHMPWLKHLSSRSLPTNQREGVHGGISSSWTRDMDTSSRKVMDLLKDYIEKDLVETYDAVLPLPPPIAEKIYGKRAPVPRDRVKEMCETTPSPAKHGRRSIETSPTRGVGGATREGRGGDGGVLHGRRSGGVEASVPPSPLSPFAFLEAGEEYYDGMRWARASSGNSSSSIGRQPSGEGRRGAVASPSSSLSSSSRPASRGAMMMGIVEGSVTTGNDTGRGVMSLSRGGSGGGGGDLIRASFKGARLPSRGDPRPRSQGGDGILRPPSRAKTPGGGGGEGASGRFSVKFAPQEEDFPLGGRVVNHRAAPRPRKFRIHHGSAVTPYVPVSALQEL